jgi:tRNA A37 threonylcarbamoyladenosine synthetase subunit TsaC/SUA5/YrdC
MFLTSANISGKEEIYSIKKIKENFAEYLKK